MPFGACGFDSRPRHHTKVLARSEFGAGRIFRESSLASAAVSAIGRAVVLCALIGVPLAATAGAATPDIRSKQEEAARIVAQVQALGEEVGAAAERYNGANYRLQQLSKELRGIRADLRRARLNYRVAQERTSSRLVELHTSGGSDAPLEIILGAETLDDVLDRLEARERIAAQDAALVEQIGSQRARIARREKQLKRARVEQEKLVRRRAAEREAIEAKLAERERLLSSVRAEIERLQRLERARQARLRRQAEAALAARRRALAAAAAREAAAERQATAERETAAESGAMAPRIPAAAEDGDEAQRTQPASVAPPPADASRGARVVAIAMRHLGVPYKWGGASPSTGFDCSGLTMYVYAKIGISLPHYAAAQYQMGIPVSRSQLQPGDLVFFRGLGHMGMYIGGGNFIHAPQTGDVVKISSLNEPYRIASWVGARRIL